MSRVEGLNPCFRTDVWEKNHWTTVAYIIATGFMTVVRGNYLLFKKIDDLLLLEQNNLNIYVRGKPCVNLVGLLKASTRQ